MHFSKAADLDFRAFKEYKTWVVAKELCAATIKRIRVKIPPYHNRRLGIDDQNDDDMQV